MDLEQLHKSGKCPDRMYYQLNGKTAKQNYKEQSMKNQGKSRINRGLEIYRERRKKEIEKQIEDEVVPEIEKAIDNLLKDWQ